MSRTRLFVGVAVAGVVAVVSLGVVITVSESPPAAQAGDPSPLELQSNYSVAEAQSFSRYPLYYAGDSFAGLPLSSVWKESVSAPSGTIVADKIAQAGGADVSYVDFTYGSCVITGDEYSCSVPIEIKMFPACARNLTLYQGQIGGPLPESTTVRGVPAAYFEDGTRLEIQTGTATIVIWDSRDPPAILDVANALGRLNGTEVPHPGEPLPQPTQAAMDGTIAC